eukprot:g41836.t1
MADLMINKEIGKMFFSAYMQTELSGLFHAELHESYHMNMTIEPKKVTQHGQKCAQSDSEIVSYHANEVSSDRGYTSDSEVYTEHGKQTKVHRSATDVDIASSGWLV